MLGVLGLGVLEEQVYRALVTLGGARVDELVEHVGRPAEEVAVAVAELDVQGLVSASKARAGRWVAAPPGVALRALLNNRRHELEQAEVAAASLAELHRPEPVLDLDEVVEAVVGAEAVAQRFLGLQLSAVHEILALVTENPVAVSGEENSAEDVAVARGVTYRVVIEREAVAGSTARAALREGLSHDMEVRVVDRVPNKLVVIDGRIAMVPLSVEGEEPAALVVHSASLVAMIRSIFELVWRDAWPLLLRAERRPGTEVKGEAQRGVGGTADGAPVGVADGMTDSEDSEVVEVSPGPDDLDRQMLALLLTGASDARVAKQLDLGLRTVQRRVRVLMDLAGASTRIQLGWAARDRNWISRT